MDLKGYIKRQSEWSEKTFGKGKRTKGLIEHIKSELEEIEETPNDIMEWIDVIILGLDGAWRAGFSPEEICEALKRKQEINFNREFKKPSEDEPSFHEKISG